MKPDIPNAITRLMQFSLAAVFEYTTLCAILSAFSPAIGITSSAFLMVMALALAAKEGLTALLMLIAASISADWQFASSDGGLGIQRQLIVMLLAALLGRWYLVRRRFAGRPTPLHADCLTSLSRGAQPNPITSRPEES